jgi:hypothetical protein
MTTWLARRGPTPSNKVHALDAIALLASVLNDILAFFARIAPLKPHRLLADDTGDQGQQRAAIVIHRSRLIQIASALTYVAADAIEIGQADATDHRGGLAWNAADHP